MHKNGLLANARDQLQNLWWVRCLLATEQDKLGLILRAVLACPTNSPPWLGPSAIIDRTGVVWSNYVDEHNRMHHPALVCELDELLDNCRRLADQLELTDPEVNALFDRLRQWFTFDGRPTSEQAEDRIPADQRTH